MEKVYAHTLGCRTNQYDSEALLSGLSARGFAIASGPAEADILIINTCAVTDRALSKCRQAIRRLSRENPKARLLVAGCGVKGGEGRFVALPGVAQVFGINPLPEILYYLHGKTEAPKGPFNAISHFGERTRAHLKIQEGCDASCAYCIVPLLRGGSQSRPYNETLDQARALIDQGFAEIVITGIHIGRYNDSGKGLGTLLAALAGLSGDFRLRLSSLEPDELTEELLDLALTHPKVCCHLHLPLQSGDTAILKRMKRRYTAEAFFKKIDGLRARDSFFGLGTDVITGFPGEDAKSFRETCCRIAESPLTYGHVFPFSERKGTAAAAFGGRVDIALRKERCVELKRVFMKLKTDFYKTMIGQTATVVFESDQAGFTGNYARVKSGQPLPEGRLTEVRITGLRGGTLVAEGRN